MLAAAAPGANLCVYARIATRLLCVLFVLKLSSEEPDIVSE